MEYSVNPNDSIFLHIQLSRTDTGLFPQTKIYTLDDLTTAIDTENLTERSNGLYGVSWTNPGVRTKYVAQTIVYTDSGYTSIHPIIRPLTDIIVVGFNTTGGVIDVGFGGGRGRTMKVARLTEEEIERIAKAVSGIMMPELEKKSEFDPAKHKVMANIDMSVNDIVGAIKIPPYPAYPDVQTIADRVKESVALGAHISGLSSKIIKAIEDIPKTIIPEYPEYSEEFDEVKNNLSAIQKIVNEINIDDVTLATEKMNKLVEEFKREFSRYKVLTMIANGESPQSVYQELRMLPKEDIDKLLRGALSRNHNLVKQMARL